MKRTVCELFAGVGGFRCGLNSIRTIEDAFRPEKWETVWFNQWEPADRRAQWAHGCYVERFGNAMDLVGEDSTNWDIHDVRKNRIPDHNLLVGGFPCQDYSVASSLATSKGLEGEKGVLWWDIRETLEAKKTPFVLLENVDRLLKSPAKQRGKDFSVILACFRDLGYAVEWRVINAAEYGYQQRRRRTYIFAWKNDLTHFGRRMRELAGEDLGGAANILAREGFFAKSFPVLEFGASFLHTGTLPESIGEVSGSFAFDYENSGLMMDGRIFTIRTTPDYHGRQITLGDILEDGEVDKSYFVSKERLYYTSPEITGCEEIDGRLPDECTRTWQYVKGGKKILRTAANGHEYVFAEGPVPMIDEYDKPARTMLTSEGIFNRTTHLVRDRKTGQIRLLTPLEAERIQGFPDEWTKVSLIDGEETAMPARKRMFMMGNALVVDVIRQMEPELSRIFEEEE